MKGLIVYDSVFGNTEQIAQAMGAALGPHGEVTVLRIGEVRPEHLAGVTVLLVGSPTRGFSATPAIKTWLKNLAPRSLQGVKVAGFDTRVSMADVKSPILSILVKFFGYAAEPTAAQLVKKGGTQGMPPAGFIVKASEGPLKEGELERAAEWAKQIL